MKKPFKTEQKEKSSSALSATSSSVSISCKPLFSSLINPVVVDKNLMKEDTVNLTASVVQKREISSPSFEDDPLYVMVEECLSFCRENGGQLSLVDLNEQVFSLLRAKAQSGETKERRTEEEIKEKIKTILEDKSTKNYIMFFDDQILVI
jgi:hypothetical protein